ncbi:Uma2 family endonuclease [Endozoicomonas sp. 4G]|uniref:Uma2 family endonuclease n=1 Tax=Endozoicomonas sp. 4G TaxID=2872754 RepID=UPI0020785140|nr:Uma2 family endonuclease [Endozoicomonas sp. 4G]
MKNPLLSVDAYLESEKAAKSKSEYINGYVYAMVGGSRRHNLLTVSLATRLHQHLSGTGCDVFASDMKVSAGSDSDHIFFYPDIMVSCGHGSDDDYVEENPKLIIEILSKSTEQHDRFAKLEAYTQIATLEEYMLVSQYEVLVDLYRREGGQWCTQRYREGDTLYLRSVGLELSVMDIY